MAGEAEVIEEEVIEEVVDIWPTDWRNQIAGKDEKSLKQLERYATPADVWTKARSLESQITDGTLKREVPFPDEGSDDDKAKWRTDHGLPASFDKYELERKIDDAEKTSIDGFLEWAYGKNMTPTQVNSMVDYFYTKRDLDMDTGDASDKESLTKTEDALRVEWGGEYRAHMNRIEALVGLVPGENKEEFLNARMPDGTQLRGNPEVMKFLLSAALAISPATIVPPAGGDVMSAIEDEITAIKEVMKKDRKKYNDDEKMQARYRELLAAQAQHKK